MTETQIETHCQYTIRISQNLVVVWQISTVQKKKKKKEKEKKERNYMHDNEKS